MTGYWTRFTRTGDPHGDAAPHWPRYLPGRPVLSLAAPPTGITRTDLAASHQCSFWLPLQPALGI